MGNDFKAMFMILLDLMIPTPKNQSKEMFTGLFEKELITQEAYKKINSFSDFYFDEDYDNYALIGGWGIKISNKLSLGENLLKKRAAIEFLLELFYHDVIQDNKFNFYYDFINRMFHTPRPELARKIMSEFYKDRHTPLKEYEVIGSSAHCCYIESKLKAQYLTI